MSNHSGSYMLNALLNEILDLGMLAALSSEQKERLIKKLWEITWDYDRNCGEINDAKLAHEFGVCRCCGNLGTVLDDDGYAIEHPWDAK
jgi:hypothetical protein